MASLSNVRLKNKKDTSANWTKNNPVLLNGELIIVETDAGDIRFKVGDGTKTYTQLPFQDEGVYNALGNKVNESDLADVATSGSYNDLIDTPAITVVSSPEEPTDENVAIWIDTDAEEDTLYQPDFAQNNNTASDYIKNRPCYITEDSTYKRLDYNFLPIDTHDNVVVSSSSSDWSNNAITITLNGVTVNSVVFVAPTATSKELWNECEVECVDQGNNTLSFTCTTVPEEIVYAKIVVIGSSLETVLANSSNIDAVE